MQDLLVWGKGSNPVEYFQKIIEQGEGKQAVSEDVVDREGDRERVISDQPIFDCTQGRRR